MGADSWSNGSNVASPSRPHQFLESGHRHARFPCRIAQLEAHLPLTENLARLAKTPTYNELNLVCPALPLVLTCLRTLVREARADELLNHLLRIALH
jgi:hypothetical protein